MANKKNVCVLCGSKAELRNSHVIPEFMYEPIYDDKHRLFERRTSGERPRTHQSGYKEYLLCDTCEGLIQPWERYVSHVWNGLVDVKPTRSGNLVMLHGIDYEKFKLFQLAVLWRASVSALPIFAKVDLGNTHQLNLKKMLLAQDPGSTERYGCALYGLEHRGKPLEDLVIDPLPHRAHGHRGYTFVFGAHAWMYSVSSHTLPIQIQKGFAQEDGTVPIYIVDALSVDWLRDGLSAAFRR